RLVDAYVAEVLTLEELQVRRRTLEERLAELDREEQRLLADAVQHEQLQTLAARVEDFRASLAHGLENASFELRRALVELLIDRVVIDVPDVEIRYVIPLSGAARRNGVLRPRYRTLEQGDQAAHRRGRHLPKRARHHPSCGQRARRAARRVGRGSALLLRRV